MESYKKYKKSLARLDNESLYTGFNKNFWYNYYIDFFVKIVTNFFEWRGVPETIDRLFIEKALCHSGFVGFWEHKDFSYLISKGTTRWVDIYENPLLFKPIDSPAAKKFGFKEMYINSYTDELDRTKAVLIQNNNISQPSTAWLAGFCTKLADLEQAIQLNLNAMNRPFVVLTDDRTNFSMKNIMQKIFAGDPVIQLNMQKDLNGSPRPLQISDHVFTLDLHTEYLLDKLSDEKQRQIAQVLTMLGINNNAVDKRERLVAAEANSNNGLINSCIQVMLNTRKQACERINKCWGLNLDVYPNPNIMNYNTEMVLQENEREITSMTQFEGSVTENE